MSKEILNLRIKEFKEPHISEVAINIFNSYIENTISPKVDELLLEKNKELEVYKKALELACEETDNYWAVKSAIKKKMHLDEYFLYQAREEIEKEKKDG